MCMVRIDTPKQMDDDTKAQRLMAQPLNRRAERLKPAAEPPAKEPEEKKMRVLVIEDNPRMAAAVAAGLKEQGHAVDTYHTGYEGEEAAALNPYDVVVLDLMLPDRDGLDVCRALRRRGVKTPILILSAISATSDKVTGLNAGADDYLAKPFEFEELIARVRALLRRGQATEAAVLRVGDVELDLAKRNVKRAGQTIQ